MELVKAGYLLLSAFQAYHIPHAIIWKIGSLPRTSCPGGLSPSPSFSCASHPWVGEKSTRLWKHVPGTSYLVIACTKTSHLSTRLVQISSMFCPLEVILHQWDVKSQVQRQPRGSWLRGAGHKEEVPPFVLPNTNVKEVLKNRWVLQEEDMY